MRPKKRRATYSLCAIFIIIGIAISYFASFEKEPGLHGPIYLGPLAAVVLTATFAGFWPAIITAFGSSLAIDYFIDRPGHIFEDLPTIIHYVLSVALGALIASFLSRIREGFILLDESQRRAQVEISARENVVNIVSHDLRNPLAGLRLSMGLLKKRLNDLRDPRIEDLLVSMENTIQRMDRIIGDLLDSTRIEAGTFALHLEDMALSDLIHEMTQAFRVKCLQRQITLIEDLAPACEFRCDRVRIYQAVGNILENAIKFTPPGGIIQISTHCTPQFVNISIKDSGPGIPPEEIPHLFERYWQSKKTAHLGTGLGLFITRGIVRSHQGEISIDSEPGKGSVFTISLPRKAGITHARDAEIAS